MKLGLLIGCLYILSFNSIDLIFEARYSNNSSYYPDNDTLKSNQKITVKNNTGYIKKYTLHKKGSAKVLFFNASIENSQTIKLHKLNNENLFQQEIIEEIFKILGLPSEIKFSKRGNLIYSNNEFDFLLEGKYINNFDLQLNYEDDEIVVKGKFYNMDKDGKYSNSYKQYYIDADTVIWESDTTIYNPHPQIINIHNDYIRFKYNKEKLNQAPYKEYFEILNKVYNFEYDFDFLKLEPIERYCHCIAPGLDRRYEIELMHKGLFRSDINIMFTTDRYYRPLSAYINKKEKIWSEEFNQYVFRPSKHSTKVQNPNIYIKSFNYHLRRFSATFNSQYVYGKPMDNIDEALKHIKDILDFDETNFSLTLKLKENENYSYQLMYNGYPLINTVWNICLENCDKLEGCDVIDNAKGIYPVIDSINIETKISKQKANKIAGKLITDFIKNCDDICHYYWCDKAAEIPKPILGIIYFEDKFHFVYQYYYRWGSIWDSKQILINANDGSILKNQFN